MRPLLFITFPQGFRISEKFRHWTWRSGGKKTVKGVTDQQTHTQTDTHTDITTYRKHRPKGRCFENHLCLKKCSTIHFPEVGKINLSVLLYAGLIAPLQTRLTGLQIATLREYYGCTDWYNINSALFIPVQFAEGKKLLFQVCGNNNIYIFFRKNLN